MDAVELLDELIALTKKIKLTMALLKDLSSRVERIESELIRHGFRITRPLEPPDSLTTTPLPSKPTTEQTDRR